MSKKKSRPIVAWLFSLWKNVLSDGGQASLVFFVLIALSLYLIEVIPMEWARYLFGSTILVLFVNAVRRHSDDVARVSSRMIEVFVGLLLSAAFAYFFVMTTVGANASNPFAVFNDQTYIFFFMIAILVFAIQLIADSSRLASGFLDSLDQKASSMEAVGKKLETVGKDVASAVPPLKNLEEKADEMEEQVNRLNLYLRRAERVSERLTEGAYSSLLAKKLNLQLEGLKRADNNTDEELVNAIDYALETIKVWFDAGNKNFEALKGGEHYLRATWWRLIQVYCREERYDLSRFELATNVRNYAFLLLSLITKFTEIAKVEGRKVVVFQCTPFSPKDFYNFPSGGKGTRFYYDAEFFGTYRRALGHILNSSSVIPLRMILADAQVGSDYQSDPIVSPGWSLDPIKKLKFDLGRGRLFPASLPISVGRNTLESISVPSAKKLLPTEGHPVLGRSVFRRVPRGAGTATFNFVPYTAVLDGMHGESWGNAYIINAFRHSKYYEAKRPESRQWLADQTNELRDYSNEYESFRIFSNVVNEILEEPSEFFQKLRAIERESLLKCVGAALGKSDLDPDLEKMIDEVTSANKESEAKFDCSKTRSAMEAEIKRMQSAVTMLAADRDKILNSVGTRDANEITDSCQKIADIIENVQKYDAELSAVNREMRGALFEQRQRVDHVPISLGEQWLFNFLNYVDAEVAKIVLGDSETRNDGIPVWQQFSADVLGLRKHVCDTDVPDNISESICQRLRVVGLKIRNQDAPEPELEEYGNGEIDRLYEDGISPEFTLVGLLPEGASHHTFRFEDVEWLGMIHTEMSEPFATCRVQFEFISTDEDGLPTKVGPLHSHIEWARMTWNSSAQSTKKIVDDSISLSRDLHPKATTDSE